MSLIYSDSSCTLWQATEIVDRVQKQIRIDTVVASSLDGCWAHRVDQSLTSGDLDHGNLPPGLPFGSEAWFWPNQVVDLFFFYPQEFYERLLSRSQYLFGDSCENDIWELLGSTKEAHFLLVYMRETKAPDWWLTPVVFKLSYTLMFYFDSSFSLWFYRYSFALSTNFIFVWTS